MKRTVNLRSVVAALHDGVMAAASFVIALYLRLGDAQFHFVAPHLAFGTVLFTIISLVVFTSMRLYSGLWRFASMRDMLAIAKSATLAVLIFLLCMFIFTRLEHMPRSVFFIHWMLLMILLAAPRFAYRALKDRTLFWEMTLAEKAKIPVLVVGANNLSEQFIQDMARDPRTAYRVVGLLDDDPLRHHRMLHRTRIYGGTNKLEAVVRFLEKKSQRPYKILLADAALRGEALQHLMRSADALALPVARIPRLSEFKRHFDERMDIQPIALEDLLGRSQMVLDREAMQRLVQGKRVLVTGAGGSIGGELVRQIAANAPGELVLLDSSEYHLYEIERALRADFSALVTRAVLGDVRDTVHMAQLFGFMQPELVFHAAAIKHVPLAEQNTEEAVLTNVFGTRCIADACVAHGVAAMVMISTDKAVNPTSIMGASKRLAESYCQALARKQGVGTNFMTVRFGNVLGSTGSVVPLFQEQIAKGGPVTVTHPEMTRYFMTVREAVELVLQAAALGKEMHDKREHIFVLDMGKPIRIMELAEQMIRLAGLRPVDDISIKITGLRPGEKLHEELFHTGEQREKTPHASIFLASSRPSDYSELALALDGLKAACTDRNRIQVVALLKRLVPECSIF